jgi:hypothetical protein
VRRVLLDWPCRLFDLWWTLYTVALSAFVMIVVTLTVLMLLLDFAGYRFGW